MSEHSANDPSPDISANDPVAQVLAEFEVSPFPELTAELKSSFLSPRIIERRRASSVLESWGPKAREVAPLLQSYLEEATDRDMPGHIRRALGHVLGTP